jgi:hypothetical protein
LFESLYPLVLARDGSSDLFISLLDMHEVFLLGSTEIPAQVSLSDFAGVAKVLIIGIDFKRMLKRSQTLLLASLFLGYSSADEFLPSFHLSVNHDLALLLAFLAPDESGMRVFIVWFT